MYFEFRKHQLAYIALVCGLLGLAVLYLAVWPYRWPLRLVSLAIGAFYLTWGVVSHVKTQTLTKKVTYEYAGVAGLATLLLWLITF